MGKNRKFKNVYQITIEGVTTNGFQAKLCDDFLNAFVQAIGINSQQTSVKSEVIETVGDFDAIKKEVKED